MADPLIQSGEMKCSPRSVVVRSVAVESREVDRENGCSGRSAGEWRGGRTDGRTDGRSLSNNIAIDESPTPTWEQRKKPSETLLPPTVGLREGNFRRRQAQDTGRSVESDCPFGLWREMEVK